MIYIVFLFGKISLFNKAVNLNMGCFDDVEHTHACFLSHDADTFQKTGPVKPKNHQTEKVFFKNIQ